MTEDLWRGDLTRREIEVCEMVAKGLTNKQVGDRLAISHRTVEDYRARAMKKLGVNNVVALVRKVLGVD